MQYHECPAGRCRVVQKMMYLEVLKQKLEKMHVEDLHQPEINNKY